MPQAIREIVHSPSRIPIQMNPSEVANETVYDGIARLLEGQQRFAEEFGLPLNRVFRHEHGIGRRETAEQILQHCFSTTGNDKNPLEELINDLVEHNLALYAALDGVAKQSLDKLSPEVVRSKGFRLFGWRPFAWLSYQRLHRSYQTNDYLRHHELIVNGFAKEYIAYREQLLKTTHGNTPDK